MNPATKSQTSRLDRHLAFGLGLLGILSISTPASGAPDRPSVAPARVSGLSAVGASGIARNFGSLDEIRVAPRAYRVSFDAPMFDPPGDDALGDVTAPGAYKLLADYPTPGLQSTSCDAISPDDSVVPVHEVTYDAVNRLVTFRFEPTSQLVDYEGQYRILLCDGEIWDDAGNALDGDGDGQSGGTYEVSFRVETKSLILNSNFDRDTASWTPVASGPAEWFHDPMDSEDVATSGSGAFENVESEDGLGAFQCVNLSAIGDKMRLRAKLVAPNASSGWEWEGHLVCSFFAQPDCNGESFDGFDLGFIVVAPFDGWQTRQKEFYPPTETLSAQCGLLAYPEFETEYCLDSVELVVLPLFADDFESGNPSRWSVVEPANT